MFVDSSCSLKASTLEGLPAQVQAAAAYAVLSSAFKAKKVKLISLLIQHSCHFGVLAGYNALTAAFLMLV